MLCILFVKALQMHIYFTINALLTIAPIIDRKCAEVRSERKRRKKNPLQNKTNALIEIIVFVFSRFIVYIIVWHNSIHSRMDATMHWTMCVCARMLFIFFEFCITSIPIINCLVFQSSFEYHHGSSHCISIRLSHSGGWTV